MLPALPRNTRKCKGKRIHKFCLSSQQHWKCISSPRLLHLSSQILSFIPLNTGKYKGKGSIDTASSIYNIGNVYRSQG